MSDEELTPRELEELEELAVQKGELEVGKAKTQGVKLQEEEERRRLEFRKKSKGMVLTDIDLPFGRVFWVTVQFFVAGLVLAIPIWIIIFAIVS
mgnify:CR=1 FL=1|tara:strand:- start:1238 stop:1519 length:282 start_codon:yes stop_codon:yes gene_type:complete